MVLIKETFSPDRWDYYKDYLLACFELIKAGDADTTIETSFKFISKVRTARLQTRKVSQISLNFQLEDESRNKVRGPFLARMEMHKRMREINLDADELLGDYQELLVEYFRMFGNKKCCANDLKMFLDYLDAGRRSELASKLIQDTGISSTTLPQDVSVRLLNDFSDLIEFSQKDQLQRHICSLQISRLCGAHSSLSAEHLQALYSALSLHYEHSFSAFDRNLLPTDIGLSDQYALLAGELG